MSITLSVFGVALTFSVALRSMPHLETPDRPPMEADGAGQFELAPAPLWAGDEFGFRSTP